MFFLSAHWRPLLMVALLLKWAVAASSAWHLAPRPCPGPVAWASPAPVYKQEMLLRLVTGISPAAEVWHLARAGICTRLLYGSSWQRVAAPSVAWSWETGWRIWSWQVWGWKWAATWVMETCWLRTPGLMSWPAGKCDWHWLRWMTNGAFQ